MSVKPMLGDWELPCVTQLETLEERALVELNVPGRSGNLYQDLNRMPARIYIAGSVFGYDPGQTFLQDVRDKYQEGEPLTFVSDIATGTDVQYVVVQSLHIQSHAEQPDQIDYSLWLAESPPPPPPSSLLGDIDTGLLDDAMGLLDTAMGALDALEALGSIPNLSDPTVPLNSTLDDTSSTMDELGGAGAAIKGLFS
jgi:hypothetical protein